MKHFFLFSLLLEGEPATLKHVILPALSSFVTGWPAFSDLQLQPLSSVAAYQYDQLDYTQLLEGLPYKWNAGKLFPEARYGLKRISRIF